MTRRALVFLLFFVLEARADELARTASQLLRNAHPDDAFERAAFIVDDGESLRLVEWPFRREFRAARWEGALPANTIAIAHTHPHGMPMPSPHDVAEARRVGLPIYVVTRGSVWIATAEGEMRSLQPKRARSAAE